MIKKLSYLAFICSLSTNVFASEYSDWLASQNQSFTMYKKSLDDEFSDMLKKQWTEYKTFNTPSAYNSKKPKVLPVIKKTIDIPLKELKKSVKIKIKPIKKTKASIPKRIIQKPIYKYGYSNIEFDFFNQNIKIQYDDKVKFDLFDINQNNISKSWKILSQTDYKKLIKQINNYSNLYKLNDWARYLLIHKIAMNIYDNKNKANIFTWFIFTKMKYDMKIAYSNENIYLLANVKEKLYQVSFFTLENKRYSILNPNGKAKSIGSIYTYPTSYPNANKKLTFDMQNHAINLSTNIKQRELEFKYKDTMYKISAKFSSDLIDFYKTFPQSQYNLYYNSKKSTILKNSLLVQLKPLIKNKTELEAVNLILRFVQNAFLYKTDQEQFSYEKVFFPEETLFYKYSDCEDRSILFSYLVKNLTKLDVVGVKYKDHLSAAVNFSTNIKGDKFSFNNKIFTITDPTYINANVGKTMPQYKNSRFTIINQSLF